MERVAVMPLFRPLNMSKQKCPIHTMENLQEKKSWFLQVIILPKEMKKWWKSG